MKTYSKLSKLNELVKEKPKQEVKEFLGFSHYHSDFDIWSYDLIKNIFFRRELVLFFADDIVNDMIITDYLLGNKIKEHIY